MIRLDFDPTIAPFGLTVRLETLALAGVIFLMLVLAGLGAGRMQPRRDAGAHAVKRDKARLRRDDLILIAVGAVPGAVVGARIDYALIHWDYFKIDPNRLLDPGQGGLALTLAVVLGTITGLSVALLLGASTGRWLHVASGPLLYGLGLGKLAMVLGGDGQGRFSDATYATVYVRPGPWQSANPGTPALPSQALEGILVLIAALLILVVPVVLRFRLRRWRWIVRPGFAARRDWWILTGYRRFLSALCLWSAARFGAAFTWRDPDVAGPLGVEQIMLLALFGFSLVIFVIGGLWEWRRRRASARIAARVASAPRAPDLPEPRTGTRTPAR